MEISDGQMREAIDRIARTPDGAALYYWLQRVLMSYANDGAAKGALWRNDGRRSLAHELTALMAEGMRSGGYAESALYKREPAAARGRQSAREFLAAELAAEQSAELAGYDEPTDIAH